MQWGSLYALSEVFCFSWIQGVFLGFCQEAWDDRGAGDGTQEQVWANYPCTRSPQRGGASLGPFVIYPQQYSIYYSCYA